jgi:hypothetical protein
VPGQHYSLDRIWLCLSCILAGKASLQAVPRLLGVFDDFIHPGRAEGIPDWTTSRMWLMRLGLGQLRLPVVQADDWVWLLDHSVQLGRERCLVVLGGRLSAMPRWGPLARADLRLLHLRVMRDPDMHSNHQELLEVLRLTGPPRAILSDHGADLRGGLRLLRQGAGLSGTLDVYDVKHRCALALQHRLEDDVRWAEFLSLIGRTRNALKQTEWAFLLPPVQRSKSRYLNLGEMLRWATRTSWLMQHRPRTLLEHGEPERLQQKMGWLPDFADELELWRQWYRVAARTEQAVRNRGLYRGADVELQKRLAPVAQQTTSKAMAAELTSYVREQSEGVKAGERVPGSTQVLESCLGTLKALEKDQSRSGFTGLVLGLGALLGRLSKEVVRQCLESTPIKAVRRWCAENVGQSLQSKRANICRLAGVTDLG